MDTDQKPAHTEGFLTVDGSLFQVDELVGLLATWRAAGGRGIHLADEDQANRLADGLRGGVSRTVRYGYQVSGEADGQRIQPAVCMQPGSRWEVQPMPDVSQEAIEWGDWSARLPSRPVQHVAAVLGGDHPVIRQLLPHLGVQLERRGESRQRFWGHLYSVLEAVAEDGVSAAVRAAIRHAMIHRDYRVMIPIRVTFGAQGILVRFPYRPDHPGNPLLALLAGQVAPVQSAPGLWWRADGGGCAWIPLTQGGARVEPESIEARILPLLADGPRSKSELSEALGQQAISGPLNAAMREMRESGWVEYTIPDTPRSRLQAYRLTERGQLMLAQLERARTRR